MNHPTMRARYWATMIVCRRGAAEPQIREIGPANDEEALDVLIAAEWRKAERAGLLVADIRERVEE